MDKLKKLLKDWGPVTLAGIAAWILYLFYREIPQLRAEISKQRSDMQESQVELSRVLADERLEQRKQLDLLSTDLIAIRANVIRLCSRDRQLDKTCDVRELVGAVKAVGRVQAAGISSAQISTRNGRTPEVTSMEARTELAAGSHFPSGSELKTKTGIANAIAWTAAAKDAKWTATDGRLLVNFANGNASFATSALIPGSTLEEYAAQLNRLSDSFSQATLAIEPQNGNVPEERPRDGVR